MKRYPRSWCSVLCSATYNCEMKSLVVLVCVILAAASSYATTIPDPYLQQYRSVFGKCLKEDVSGDGGMKKLREIIDGVKSDHEMGCLIACVMKEFKLINHSEFMVDLAKKAVETFHIDEPTMTERLKEATEVCSKKTKDIEDECNRTFAFTECYLKHYQ